MTDLSQAVPQSAFLQPAPHTACNLPPLCRAVFSPHPVFIPPSHHTLLKHHAFLQVFSETGLMRVTYYVVGFKSSVYLSRGFFFTLTFSISVNEKCLKFRFHVQMLEILERRSAPCWLQMNGPLLFSPTQLHAPSHLHSYAAFSPPA